VLCNKHGLHADHSRTTDISSVLRPPGTHHRKRKAREVLCGLIVGPFPINIFSVLLEHANSADTSRTGNRCRAHAAPPDYLKTWPERGLAAIALHNLDRASGPTSGEIIAEHCAQLREFRDQQGRIPEPQWYYGLGVLVHCDDGDLLAHAWSCGDERYSHAETQERLDRAREFGQITCAKFHDISSAPCERCPHWQKITSPIQLGRDTERNCGAAPNERGETENTRQRTEGSDKANTEEQRSQKQGSTEENMFGKKPPPRLEIISMDEVEGQNIDFLWPNRVALGKHSALAGIGGKGKSHVLYSTSAIITTGGLWPCGEGSAPQGSVVLLSAEDDIADMMQPRLIAAGANLKRVKAIKAVIDTNGGKKRFNLLADLEALYQACRQLGDVVMIGIDPLGSYLGGELDTHRDAALRHALDPISEMASAARCSVFSVMHFNKATSMKAAVDRVMGGAGFVNAPRCALGLLVDPDDERKRMLLGLKTNIGPMPQGLRMHLEMVDAGIDQRTGLPIRATHVTWDGPTDLTADAVMAMTNERETPKLDEAIAFLQGELKDGPRPVEGVKSHATALGISPATLKRAREQIGVIARQIKGSPHGGWEYLFAIRSI
jgi:hypothetical protein